MSGTDSEQPLGEDRPQDEASLDPPFSVAPSPGGGVRLKAIALGLGILVCGMLLGGSLTFAFLARREMGPPPGGPHAEHVIQRLRSDLDLTPKQEEAILAILTRADAKMEALRAQIDPQVRETMESVKDEVAAQLDPQQKEKWLKRSAEMDKRLPHPPGPPQGEGPPGPPPDDEGPHDGPGFRGKDAR